MRIAITCDVWHPQINGVVTTLTHTIAALNNLGHEVKLITPDLFRTYTWPGYPEDKMAFLCGPKLRPILKSFKPDALHLVTETAIGFATRRYSREFGYHYTSSYLPRFPEYLKLRYDFPVSISSAYLQWFHRRSARVLVATESLAKELSMKGYRHIARWSRGVDMELFKPRDKNFITAPRPIFMFVGRVAVEKNIGAFLQLDLPGTKYIVGDGPSKADLQKNYPNAVFTGYQQGEKLAKLLAAADVFVFPSRTDTFGLVALEALASGVPVAAFPVPGPLDIITDPQVGILHTDLHTAAMTALSLKANDCREFASQFTWQKCTQQLVNNLVPMV